MKPKRFTEEPIISILQQGEAGVKAADLCRQHGMGEAVSRRFLTYRLATK